MTRPEQVVSCPLTEYACKLEDCLASPQLPRCQKASDSLLATLTSLVGKHKNNPLHHEPPLSTEDRKLFASVLSELCVELSIAPDATELLLEWTLSDNPELFLYLKSD